MVKSPLKGVWKSKRPTVICIFLPGCLSDLQSLASFRFHSEEQCLGPRRSNSERFSSDPEHVSGELAVLFWVPKQTELFLFHVEGRGQEM